VRGGGLEEGRGGEGVLLGEAPAEDQAVRVGAVGDGDLKGEVLEGFGGKAGGEGVTARRKKEEGWTIED
jgi:hypothetical protein